MRRRDFIKAITLTVSAPWPFAARAQQGERVRLVCFFDGLSADTPSAKERYAAFLEGLQQLGWTPGRNVRLEARWGEGNEAVTQKHAAELVALAPDVIFAQSTPVTAALQRETRTIPIVFVAVSDPIGSGSSPIWRGRVATSRAFCITRRASQVSGLLC
jgi:putative ABC transport system substrate-binding protein